MIKVNRNHHRGKYNNAKTGEYTPLNPQKYVGQQKPIYKSSLEKGMMMYLDRNPNVIQWSYEALSIWYLDKSTFPARKRQYYIDFVAVLKDLDGTLKKVWIEVKDSREVRKPNPKNVKESKTFIKNMCKWEQAKKTAQENNAEFRIITEEQLR